MSKKLITKSEFIQQHAELKKKFKEIKQALRAVHKMAKPFVKSAHKLYHQGDKLYIEDAMAGIKPPFKALPKMMDDLEFWRTLDTDLTF